MAFRILLALAVPLFLAAALLTPLVEPSGKTSWALIQAGAETRYPVLTFFVVVMAGGGPMTVWLPARHKVPFSVFSLVVFLSMTVVAFTTGEPARGVLWWGIAMMAQLLYATLARNAAVLKVPNPRGRGRWLIAVGLIAAIAALYLEQLNIPQAIVLVLASYVSSSLFEPPLPHAKTMWVARAIIVHIVVCSGIYVGFDISFWVWLAVSIGGMFLWMILGILTGWVDVKASQDNRLNLDKEIPGKPSDRLTSEAYFIHALKADRKPQDLSFYRLVREAVPDEIDVEDAEWVHLELPQPYRDFVWFGFELEDMGFELSSFRSLKDGSRIFLFSYGKQPVELVMLVAHPGATYYGFSSGLEDGRWVHTLGALHVVAAQKSEQDLIQHFVRMDNFDGLFKKHLEALEALRAHRMPLHPIGSELLDVVERSRQIHRTFTQLVFRRSRLKIRRFLTRFDSRRGPIAQRLDRGQIKPAKSDKN